MMSIESDVNILRVIVYEQRTYAKYRAVMSKNICWPLPPEYEDENIYQDKGVSILFVGGVRLVIAVDIECLTK